MTKQEMIDSYLKNNEINQCDNYDEDEACIFRDTIKTKLDGTIIGRRITTKTAVRTRSHVKQTLKTAPPESEG